jgi:hypothetical protein
MHSLTLRSFFPPFAIYVLFDTIRFRVVLFVFDPAKDSATHCIETQIAEHLGSQVSASACHAAIIALYRRGFFSMDEGTTGRRIHRNSRVTKAYELLTKSAAAANEDATTRITEVDAETLCMQICTINSTSSRLIAQAAELEQLVSTEAGEELMALLRSADRAESTGCSKPQQILRSFSRSDAVVFASSKHVICSSVCALLQKMATRRDRVLQLVSTLARTAIYVLSYSV